MYRAVQTFRDLQDGHLYKTDDPFPHDGRVISPDRIKSLLNGNNRASKPLIRSDDKLPTETSKQAQRAKKTPKKR